MITLHYFKNDRNSRELKSRLDGWSLRYEVIEHEEGEGLAFIQEDETIIKGQQELEQWFQKLEQELKWQRSISGDGCYIDPDSGEIC